MIPQAFIQDLLARVDVAEVVGRHVKLRKAGANLIGLCPFHGEKSPSFTVSPSKQFYHCFGCQAHGSAISFLMEHAGLTFVEAVEDLAREMGLTVPQEAGTPGSGGARNQPNLIEVLDQAARFYQRRLREAPVAIEYLKGRGLSGATAARFGLGYAPPGWRNLEAVAADYDDEAWEQAGLVKTNADQLAEAGAGNDSQPARAKRYDRFRERVMFPIRNPRGSVIGFGARILHKGEPKYLNSPETPVFSKGRELYGLFEGRQALREKNQAIVVEGYMDVVMLAEHGVDNAVATLGTATTPDHVRKLLRQVDHLVFSFDGDAAGRKAAWRALQACLPIVSDTQQVSFLFLPDGTDPDDYVRAHGQAGFYQQIEQAQALSAFMLKGLTDTVPMETPEGRARFLAAARPLLLALGADGLRLQIKHQVAELGRIGLVELDRFLDAGEPAARSDSAAGSAAPEGHGYDQAAGPAPARGGSGGYRQSGGQDGGQYGNHGDHGQYGNLNAGQYGNQNGGYRQNGGKNGGQGGGYRQGGNQNGGYRSEGGGRQGGGYRQGGRGGGGRRQQWSGGGAQPRVGRPSLERLLRLLAVCHPTLCRDAISTADPAIMPPELWRWLEMLAALPDGASAEAALEALRPEGFPDLYQVEQDLAAQFAGISLLGPEEAKFEFDGALAQLTKRAMAAAATNLVENGLDTEEARRIHRELLASKR